jgi:hypothetical protein
MLTQPHTCNNFNGNDFLFRFQSVFLCELNHTTMSKNVLILIILFFTVAGQSQNLKLEEIMKGDAFIGVQPSNGRWSLDGKKIYFEWNPNNDLGTSTYFWEKGMLKPQLSSAKEAAFSKLDFMQNPNSDVAYYISKGALYSY